MAIDIAQLIFMDFLQMSEYATMSTGNIMHDLIMLLFLPTILIIFVVYQSVGAVIKNRGLRLLVGIGLYMFIIVEGFYQMFAYFAKAYFLFLLFIVGLLFFLPRHFSAEDKTKKDEGGGLLRRHLPSLSLNEQDKLRRRENDLKDDLEKAEEQYNKVLERDKSDKSIAKAQERVNEIREELREVRRKRRGG